MDIYIQRIRCSSDGIRAAEGFRVCTVGPSVHENALRNRKRMVMANAVDAKQEEKDTEESAQRLRFLVNFTEISTVNTICNDAFVGENVLIIIIFNVSYFLKIDV